MSHGFLQGGMTRSARTAKARIPMRMATVTTIIFFLRQWLPRFFSLLFLIEISIYVVIQVGEHLLSLVNEIETFSSSDAIYDLVPLLGTASELSNISKCWRPLILSSDSKEVFLLVIWYENTRGVNFCLC